MTETRRQKNNFVKHLRQIIEDNGWKADDFQRIIGFNKSTVYRWINGYKDPSSASIKAVCDKLKVSYDEMLSAEEDAPYPIYFLDEEKKYLQMLTRLPKEQRIWIEDSIKNTSDLIYENDKIKNEAQEDREYREKNEKAKRKKKQNDIISSRKVADHPQSSKGDQSSQYNGPSSSDLK